MKGEINKFCGLDIHKLFVIATILSRPDEKQQQRFTRDDGILALKNWVPSENVTLLHVNQQNTIARKFVKIKRTSPESGRNLSKLWTSDLFQLKKRRQRKKHPDQKNLV